MSKLQEAFREAARREFLFVPPEEELDYVFSARFERRMRQMLRANTYGYWHLINTTAKRAAIVAAVLLMLLSCVMAVRSIRERVIQFFVDVYEEYFEVRFGVEEKDDIDPLPRPMVRFTLTELPEGYEEAEFVEADHILWTKWLNKHNDSVNLQQETGTQEIILNSRLSDIHYLFLGEIKIAYQRDRATTFVWEQHGYVFTLSVQEELPIEQVLDMISSLSIAEAQNNK